MCKTKRFAYLLAFAEFLVANARKTSYQKPDLNAPFLDRTFLMVQGLYGQGKSGENISFSRWSGKVRENQGKSGNSTKKSGKTWKKSGNFFWKVLTSHESRSIVYFSCCMSNKLDFLLFSLFRYFLSLKVAWNV